MNKAWLISIGIIIGFAIIELVNVLTAPKPISYPIVDKYEHNGKCYIAIEQEITPEDYIGYDIGMDRQQLSTWLYRKDGKTLEIVKNIADVLDCDIALVDRTTGEIYK